MDWYIHCQLIFDKNAVEKTKSFKQMVWRKQVKYMRSKITTTTTKLWPATLYHEQHLIQDRWYFKQTNKNPEVSRIEYLYDLGLGN